ncbi:MAG TPA: TetR/AcrR family transcriptional regulator [Pseudonocardiaceae bacterium]|jgi:AcrR family transcriptional regulator|nr:TetR/AcrR family transcriptional regulator [Pseudonocardiaceae bacterium]
MADRTTTPPDYVSPIVRTAASLFARQGYRGTSMRDIGKAVGVHAGSLYVHIESKEQLLESIVLHIMERSEQDMAEVLAEGGTATEQLYGIAARDLRLIGENKEFATVFFHEWRNLSEERQQRVIASRDRWEADLRSVFTRGIAGGEFRDIEPRIAGIVLTSILNWAYVWYSPDGDLSTDELARRFVDIVVNGTRA